MYAINKMKVSVLRFFLGFVKEYVGDLSLARMVTLGGNGVEAGLWLENNIPPDQGWVVEKSKTLSHDLIRRSPYRYCNQLTHLPRVFRSVYGRNAYADAVHFDFCGMLEPNHEVFDACLGLLKHPQSAGCIAITVADQRRNTSLEDPQLIKKTLLTHLSKSKVEFLQAELYKQQLGLMISSEIEPGFDPQKGAEREIGTFSSVLDAFMSWEILPDRVERVLYVSNYNGGSFRMRTYVFHMARDNQNVPGAKQILQAWLNSPIRTVSEEGVNMPNGYSQLEAFIAFASPAVKAEYERLKAQASNVHAQIAIDGIEAVLATYRKNSHVLVAPEPAKPLVLEESKLNESKDAHAAAALPVPENEAQAKALRMIRLLDAYAEGDVVFKEEGQVIARELKIGRNANRRRALGGRLAHTSGLFRPKFTRTLQNNFSAEVFEMLLGRVAAAHSKLAAKSGEKGVTVKDLLTEAGL